MRSIELVRTILRSEAASGGGGGANEDEYTMPAFCARTRAPSMSSARTLVRRFLSTLASDAWLAAMRDRKRFGILITAHSKITNPAKNQTAQFCRFRTECAISNMNPTLAKGLE